MSPVARRALTFLTALVAMFAVPAVASATDRWVDAQTGTDGTNNCTVQANPCATITQASNSSQSAGNFGTIHVDQGTYVEQVNIAQRNFLTPEDFVPGDTGETAIAPTAPGVAAFAQANATIQGFEIRGPASSTVAIVGDDAKLIDNTILASADNSTAVDARSIFTGSPTVEGNTILADSGDEANAVTVNAGTNSARILDNEIGEPGEGGFDKGVWVRNNATATVAGNTILGSDQRWGSSAKAIHVQGAGDVTVSRNLITSPVLPSEADGIYVENPADGATIALDHNTVRAMTGIGVVAADTSGSTVRMEGDLVAANGDRAIYAGQADAVQIVNATIVGNHPMQLNSASVSIDSSILDVPITTSGGTVSCEIAHTRGPAIAEGGNGCAEFQTTADPKFVEPSTFDYHLQPDSPLIDLGDPAPPADGAVDVDGDARALEGDGECPVDAERDMGYDEVVAGVPVCEEGPPPPPSDPRDTAAPETSVAGASKQRGKRARFQISATEPGSAFECRIDRGRFAPCRASFRTRKLNEGRHTVFARATDAAGNTDPTPVAMKFKLRRGGLR